jgi:hypothetical protein
MVGTAPGAVDVRALIEQSRTITNVLADEFKADVLTITGGPYQALLEQMEQETILSRSPARGSTTVRQRATLGIMLKGLTIDAVMVGGPAANSNQVPVPNTVPSHCEAGSRQRPGLP